MTGKAEGKAAAFIRMDGTPRDTGRALGEGGGAFLRRRARLLKRLQRERALSARDVDARVAAFERCLKKVARHWLDEAAGMAKGAGVAVRDILLMNCPPPGMHTGVLDSCTSFLSVGEDVNRMLKGTAAEVRSDARKARA